MYATLYYDIEALAPAVYSSFTMLDNLMSPVVNIFEGNALVQFWKISLTATGKGCQFSDDDNKSEVESQGKRVRISADQCLANDEVINISK